MTDINLSLHVHGPDISFIRSIVFKLKMGRCIQHNRDVECFQQVEVKFIIVILSHLFVHAIIFHLKCVKLQGWRPRITGMFRII
jgi:hypothetical protein